MIKVKENCLFLFQILFQSQLENPRVVICVAEKKHAQVLLLIKVVVVTVMINSYSDFKYGWFMIRLTWFIAKTLHCTA